jgi:hypothetical protein
MWTKRQAAIAASVGLVAVLSTATARAEHGEESYLASHGPAPVEHFELTVGNGYAQGFGRVTSTRTVDQVAGAGLDLNVSFDDRLTRRWSVGLQTSFNVYTREQNTSVGGLAATLGATYHLSPTLRGNPWVRLGAGYRLLWEDDPPGAPGASVYRYALQLASLRLGYDVSLSEGIAIAPTIGGDLDVFVWDDYSNGSSAVRFDAFCAFLLAGLQGRFDF